MLRVASYGDQRLGSEAPLPQGAATNSVADQTHKHRAIWLCPLRLVSNAVRSRSKRASLSQASSRQDSLAETAGALWRNGILRVLASAPRMPYAWRMTISPASDEAGDFVGIMLQWCGDKLVQHASLRRAASVNGEVDAVLGVLGPCFAIAPQTPGPGLGAVPFQGPATNVFEGILAPTRVEAVERRRGITLMRDQQRLLEVMNPFASPILSAPSHPVGP